MPNASRESATKSEEVGPVRDRFEVIRRDVDDICNAGEAFHTPPGRTPLTRQTGTEVLVCSPEELLGETGRAVRRNAQEPSLHVSTSY